MSRGAAGLYDDAQSHEPQPPGWYRDPTGEPLERYWDGSQWTRSTRPYPPPAVPADWARREVAAAIWIVTILVAVIVVAIGVFVFLLVGPS